MATCKDYLHEKVCVWNAELEKACNEDCSDFKNKADFNKTIDDLITEIHCLEAKCRKYEEEIARLKSIIKEMSEEDI